MTTLFPRLAFPDDHLAIRLISDEGVETLTYRALRAECDAYLHALNEPLGTRIGVVANRDLGTMIALVGNALGGLVSVPLNPKLGTSARAHILADAKPSRIATTTRGWGEDAFILKRGHEDGSAAQVAPIGEAPALVLYTSGTTGKPKGAILTRRNVAFNIDALAANWELTDADVITHALPIFHVHGLVLGLFGSLRVGATFTHVARFSPVAVGEALTALTPRPAVLFAVPTMYHRLADALDDVAAEPVRRALSSARLLVSGSAGLAVREHRRLEAATGRGVHERYGLTETLINCGVPGGSASQPGYVGPPLPGVELLLVDDERVPLSPEASVDDQTIGEVAVRGPHVFAGYLNRPDATARVLDAEGWFYTGDLATRRADGSIRIVGRRAVDLIKTGGYKVGAGEIEACLLEDPAVREVAVVGVPDDDLGERIIAFVVASERDETPRDVLAARLTSLVAQELTPHKRPRDVRFVEALPRNAMGKIVKPELKKSFAG